MPACADGEVMNTLMRQTWNFTGSIVSDVRNTTAISARDFRILYDLTRSVIDSSSKGSWLVLMSPRQLS